MFAWLRREKEPLPSPDELRDSKLRRKAWALLVLAQNEQAIRCRRAAIQKNIEQAAGLGRIPCVKR